MKKINKKGFSMVELLAVITILGILAAISIVSVQRILEKAKDEYYQKQKNNLIMATQSYMKASKENQPKVLGQVMSIYLKDLLKNKYIDKLVDYSKKPCDVDNTYVDVFYHDMNEDYEYTAYLKCPGYSDPTSTKLSPTIEIEFRDTLDKKVQITMKGSSSDNKLKLYSYSYKIYKKDVSGKLILIKRYETKKKVDAATKTISENLKEYVPGDIIVEVTAVNEKGKDTSLTKTNKYNQAVGGPSCLYKGDTSNKKIDATIGKKLKFEKDKTKEVTVGCKDEEYGCINETYTKKFTGDIKTGYIMIANKKGIQTKCEVDVYIDNNNPKVDITDLEPSKPPEENTKGETVYNYEKDWTNKDVCFTYKASDNSGIKSVKWELNKKGLSKCNNSKGINDLTTVSEYTKTYSESETKETTGKVTICIKDEGYRIGKLTVKDSSGHTSIVNVTAKIDKTAPSTPTTISMFKWNDNSKEPTSTSGLKSYSNNTWTNKKVYTESSGSKDKISCIKEYEYQTTGTIGNTTRKGNKKNITTQGISTIKYRACDYAGNCSSYTSPRTIKLDWEAPTIPKVNLYKWKDNSTKPTTSTNLQGYSSGSWSNKKIFTKPSGSTDKASGNIYYQVTTTGKTTNIKDTKVEYRNVEAEGTSTVKYRACDEAGNCSNYSQAYTINIDTVKPTCGSNNGNQNWTGKDKTVTVNCSDTTSGCTQNSFSRTFSQTTKTSSITIRDKAGNTRDCSVNAYVDKTPPTCGSNTGLTNWVNYNREVTVACKDSDSGCSQTNFSKTLTTEGKTDTIQISDKVGNKTTCSVPKYIDKTKPTCGTISGGATKENGEWKWTKSNRTITLKCNDSLSGCKQNSYKETYNGDLYYSDTLLIWDNASNYEWCSVPVYIDKVPPNAPSITKFTSEDGVKVLEDNCVQRGKNANNTNNYSCTYKRTVSGTVQKNEGESYTLTTWYSTSDKGSGFDRYERTFICTNSDADYFPNYVPLNGVYSGTGPGECNGRVRAIDRAGNIGPYVDVKSISVD